MTNSIASAKCPSILTSGKYGMSQRRSIIDDSKEYIFVKLTDSAFRAIEEYQRNTQSKRLQKGQCAKIQITGNSGVIQFPPTADNSESNGALSDGRKFGFAIDDVEGSLECIQQSGTDLDVLGSLSYRMRIQANDDVYDTTRTKMAIAEETEKSKCIREIKPNQTDIGRKVKRPVSTASMQAYTNSSTSSLLNSLPNSNVISGCNSNSISNNGSSSYLSSSNSNNISSNSRNKLTSTSVNQHSPSPSGAAAACSVGTVGVNGSRLLSIATSTRSSSNPSSIGGNGTVGSSNNRYGSPLNLISSNLSTLSTNISNYGGNYSPPGTCAINSSGSYNSQQKKSNIGNVTSSTSNSAAFGKSSFGNNSKANGISNGKHLDVSRRKIRERLIHLLALRPFKKPELYSRLQNEGLAQRERQLISTVLKDISTLSRDNTYNLRRSMWNDVDENWPFFSEQEIQQLKRRKPQNLTPPTSSDASSSISEQSPTSSTHTGSPPPLMNGIGGGSVGIKRTSIEPDFYDGTLTLGLQSKKQRISHYKKDIATANCLLNNSISSGGGRTSLGLGSNSSSSLYNQNNKSSSASYSPNNYNTPNNNGNDENFSNSDLTFNVLNNVDDFIQHTAVVVSDSGFGTCSKTSIDNNKISPSSTSGSTSISTSSNNSTNNSCSSIMPPKSSKDKHKSGGNSNFSSYYSNRETSLSSNSAVRRKNSPPPYANNFVPEIKSVSNSNSNNGCRLNKQQQVQKTQQQSSPNYENSSNHYFHKSINNSGNNSVIPNLVHAYSSSSLAPTIPQTTVNPNAKSSSSRSRHNSKVNLSKNDRSSSESSLSTFNKHSRSTSPFQTNLNKHQNNTNSINNLHTSNLSQEVQSKNNNHLALQQPDDQQATFDARSSPQSASQLCQQQEHSSPTQQIAAAASTFYFTNHSIPSGDAPRYDLSSYTPITSIEQRRRYKTEFESDYDEYRKLLAQIESVGCRFRRLADRLNCVQQGCSDYYNIKDQILSEYNRIRKEESINRDKQRFDYLHEKLAHIKQLVMDYDKKLTSGLATSNTVTNPQQEDLKQQNQTAIASNPAHLSPMLQSSGESNHSPPLIIMNPPLITAVTMNNLNSKRNSRNHKKNHEDHHQPQEHYNQHHEPETIHMVNDNDDINEEEISLQYDRHHYKSYDAGNNHFILQEPATSINSTHTENEKGQQQQLQTDNIVSDSGSDSSSSSSSNDDDNSDDNSEVSDDDEDNDH